MHKLTFAQSCYYNISFRESIRIKKKWCIYSEARAFESRARGAIHTTVIHPAPIDLQVDRETTRVRLSLRKATMPAFLQKPHFSRGLRRTRHIYIYTQIRVYVLY